MDTLYVVYLQIRNMWVESVERNPDVTKEQFIAGYMMFAPAGVTEDQVAQYWEVLAKNSDSMRSKGE